MKILILLLCFATFSLAQHCPFDGANLIVIKLTNKKGKPIKNAKIALREVENDDAESCSFAKGLLNKEFEPTKTVLNNLYKIDSIAETYCPDCNFLGAGFYAVSLGMSEATCMIKDGNNYKYKKRKFVIKYSNKEQIVEQSEIHPLCLNAGKWSRIKPIEIKIR